jgi:hypothetical protein
MKLRWSRRALIVALLITPWCSTPLHAWACNKTPTLTGPSPVARGSVATYTIGNLCKTATVSGWGFTADGTTWPRASSSATSWGGRMVQSGTVKVTVVQGGTTYPLSKAVTVSPRTTGFAFTAQPATKYANGTFTCEDPSGNLPLSVPDPPTQTGQEIGLAIPCLRYSFQFNTVSDGGPNGGFWYVTSASDSAPERCRRRRPSPGRFPSSWTIPTATSTRRSAGAAGSSAAPNCRRIRSPTNPVPSTATTAATWRRRTTRRTT